MDSIWEGEEGIVGLNLFGRVWHTAMYSHQFLDLIYYLLHYKIIYFFEGKRKSAPPPTAAQSPDFLLHILGLKFNWDSSFPTILTVRHAFTATVLGL